MTADTAPAPSGQAGRQADPTRRRVLWILAVAVSSSSPWAPWR
ncbi:MAG: hypothetical protein ACXV3C_03985 [Actinomycetes bacterium]